MKTSDNLQLIDIDKLIPYINNPRTHSKEQIKQIQASLREFGFINPILIDDGYNIIAGHGRLLAAEAEGIKKIPCILVKHLTEAQKKAYILADNKLAEMAGWDMELLSIELEELKELDFDIDLTGFNSDELSDIFGEEEPEIAEDDYEVELPEEPKTKLGDIYQLGRHRLMCGDSTDKATVEKLMNGVKADMVFTDPPYGMKKENDGVANDNLNYDDLLEFNKKWIPITFNNLKDNGSWYCWGIDEPLMDIYSNILKPMMRENKITFRNLLTWDKGYGQGQLSEEFRMYPPADEKCLFVMCGVQGFNNNQDNYFIGFEPIRKYLNDELEKIGIKKGRQFENILGSTNKGQHILSKSHFNLITEKDYKKLQCYAKGQAFKKEYEEIKKEYYSTRAYFDNTHDNQNNVWHFDRTSQDERSQTGGHATPKPIALCSRAIKSSSREEEIVLDLFGGSGSTLIACEQLNRTCYMMELDPKYCDVIINRWETLTGEKAVKI